VRLRVLLLLNLLACGRVQTNDIVEQPAVATSAEPPAVVPTRRFVPVSRRILIIGDSEACAVKHYVNDVFKEEDKLHHMPNDTIDVECKVSTTVPYWGAQGHLKEALQKHPNPNVVVVFLGTNHYSQNKSPDVSVVLDGIENSGAQCVWVGNTAVNGKRWQINNLIRDAVSERCKYFDTEAANIPLADNAHPTVPGAIKWLRLVWGVVPLKFEEEHE